MKQTLRQRLEKIDLKSPPKRRATENDDGYYRLRDQLGIEFGVAAATVWKNESCPVLAWMSRCSDGTASVEDERLLTEISRTQYFEIAISTRDYLMAVPKVLRAV